MSLDILNAFMNAAKEGKQPDAVRHAAELTRTFEQVKLSKPKDQLRALRAAADKMRGRQGLEKDTESALDALIHKLQDAGFSAPVMDPKLGETMAGYVPDVMKSPVKIAGDIASESTQQAYEGYEKWRNLTAKNPALGTAIAAGAGIAGALGLYAAWRVLTWAGNKVKNGVSWLWDHKLPILTLGLSSAAMYYYGKYQGAATPRAEQMSSARVEGLKPGDDLLHSGEKRVAVNGEPFSVKVEPSGMVVDTHRYAIQRPLAWYEKFRLRCSEGVLPVELKKVMWTGSGVEIEGEATYTASGKQEKRSEKKTLDVPQLLAMLRILKEGKKRPVSIGDYLYA